MTAARRCWTIGAIVAAAVQWGCAGHESRTRLALDALDRGAPREAIAALDSELSVSSSSELPASMTDDDAALLVLDRGTIKLSLGDSRGSARDLGAADKAIDVLDLSRGATAEIGRYLFSDDVGPYRAPAHEKLLVNTLNMMNYLSMGDLVGAKVEARRLAVMQKYLRDHDEGTALLGIGSHLAGLAFEKAGDVDEALAFYDDALKHAQYASLRDPLRTLVRGEPKSPGIRAMIAGTEPLDPPGATGEAEIIVVVGFGRTPQKEPVRIPIGLALTLVSGSLSPHDHARANALAAKGLVTWVSYPTLGRGRGGYSEPTFEVDGRARAMEQALDVEAEIRAAWKRREGTLILAAITRMLTRMVAGELAEAAASKGDSPIGLLVGLATTATLAAVDTPDTRGWSTLPARIAIARVRVPAGSHTVRLAARGQSRSFRVSLPPGGWSFLHFEALR